MIKTIIIDDEQKARESISDIIRLFAENVNVVAQAEDVKTGVEAIIQHQPDLVFLDIEMPDGTGFDLLKKIGKLNFKVVFITAYQEYAVKAFKFSALDYLLKPVDPDELVAAIEKAEQSLQLQNIELKMNAFFNNMDNPSKKDKKIVLKTLESIFVVNVKDIVRCESDENYTKIFLISGKTIIVSTTLKEYDELLTDFEFFRTHKSHLINTNYINQYQKSDGGYLVMKDNSTVPIAQRKKNELMTMLQKL